MKYRTQYLSGLFMFLFLVMVTSSQVNAQDSLVAFYPFNGNAADQSGNGNHGIVNGAILSEDRFGNENSAYGFDGVDDYLVINDDDLLTPVNQKMTISLWFKTKFPGDRFILYKGSSQYNREYAMGVRTDSLASFQINHQGDWLARSSVQSTAIIEEEVWHHLVGIWNGNKLKIYINSKLENVVDTNLVIGNYDSDLYIGTYGGSISQPMNQYAFKGSIDDVRIYNYALDTLAVQDLYTEGGWPLPEDTTGIPKDTLVAYYPFNGNAADQSGNSNHGIVNGATLSEDRFGNPDNAYQFDGLDDYILLSSDFDFKERSISLWFSVAEVNGYHRLYNSDHPNLNYSSTNIDVYKDALTGELKLRLEAGGGQAEDILATIQLNTWYHALINIDTLSTIAYLDGQFIGSAPFVNHHASNGMPNAFIGANRDTTNYFFKGSIDDVRIYNQTLGDSAILDLYREGGWPLPEVDLPDTLVAHYPFSGNAEDESGFENNGIVNGANLTFDRFGNPNSAYNFNGIDNFIEIPHNSLFNSEAKTIQFWFKKNNTISDTPGLVDMEGILWKAFDTGLNRAFSFSIATEEPPFTFYLKIGNSTDSLLTAITEDAIINSRWYHAAGVISKDWISIYIDGVLVDSVSNDGQIINNTAPIVIAKASVFSTSTRYFEGVIDDIQIHNYALNSSRIWESYTEGGWPFPEDSTIIPNDTLAAYYPFNGNAEDVSGFENNGKVFGATLNRNRFGNPNSAYYFDGNNDYIELPQDFDFPERSISFWFNAKNIPEWDRENDPHHSIRSIYISDHPNIKNGLSSVWVTKINGNNKVCFHNGGADEHLDNCYSINEMQWNFATMTVTPSTIKYYLNGELLKTKDFPGNIYSVTDNGFYNAALGVGRNVNHRFFNGRIDDVRIYNYAIDDWKVQELYTQRGWPFFGDSTIVPNDTLAAYYPFNGNAEDSSGYGNHGEVIGASLDEDRFGNPNRAYTFDGIDDYIFIDNPQALHSAKNLSVSLWAKGTAVDTSFAGLISSPNMQPFGVSIDDGDRILFSVSSESVPLNLVADNLNTHPEEWYQYVAVYRANEYLKLFKNGELAAALYGSIPGFMDIDSTGIYIGSLPVTYPGTEEAFYFPGSIDDIRFYNHALSSESIRDLYETEKATPVSIETEFQLPEKFQLYQNYPNPFNPTTNIKFDLPEAGIISLKIYDMTGRLIATLVDEIKSAGSHQVTFDASQIASGVYLYELKASGYSSIKKFTLIK